MSGWGGRSHSNTIEAAVPEKRHQSLIAGSTRDFKSEVWVANGKTRQRNYRVSDRSPRCLGGGPSRERNGDLLEIRQITERCVCVKRVRFRRWMEGGRYGRVGGQASPRNSERKRRASRETEAEGSRRSQEVGIIIAQQRCWGTGNILAGVEWPSR